MPSIHRRDFLKGCCAATLAGSTGNSYAVFDATTSLTQDTLVIVFLRGAMDALSLVSPGQNHPDRGNYEDNRVDTRIPYSRWYISAIATRSSLERPIPRCVAAMRSVYRTSSRSGEGAAAGYARRLPTATNCSTPSWRAASSICRLMREQL